MEYINIGIGECGVSTNENVELMRQDLVWQL